MPKKIEALKWTPFVREKPESPERIQKEDLNLNTLPKKIQPETNSLPSHISKKYVEISGKFYFNYDTKKLAFVDKGKKLATSLNDSAVSKTMVDIAESRGWSKIKLKGEKSFRRETWLEAQARGLKTEGYNPRESDYAQLKVRMSSVQQRRPSSNSKDNSKTNKKPAVEQSKTQAIPEQEKRPEFKTLVNFGKAPYQHNPKNTQSYYADLRDNETQEISTVWGKGIEKALEEVHAKKGDKILLEKNGQKDVTVENIIKDKSGNVVERKQIDTHRNNWTAKTELNLKREKQAETILTKDTKDILANHPELKNEVIALEVANKFSKQSGMSKEDGRRFFEQARTTLARGVSNGDKVPEIKIKTALKEKQINKENEHEDIR